MKAAIIYWSSTGNTEIMAKAIAEGAKAAGSDAELIELSATSPADALAYDVLVLGSPAMGDEELEEGEVEPFFSDLESSGLSGKKVALFGSYDWGDGEWMRKWYDRAKAAGADMMQEEGLIANNEPDDDAIAACKELGAQLA